MSVAHVTLSDGAVEILDLPGDEASPALVLLHEGLGSVGLWRTFPSDLRHATGRRVIAFSRFGHGSSAPPPRPRTRAFFDEEAGTVLPELLDRLDAGTPMLVGHSDGASIALVHAASHPVAGLVLMAPHVFVEEQTLTGIRATRAAYAGGELRARIARHHDNPDAAFSGWCDVWLDPSFTDWTLDAEIERLEAPALLIQGRDDPYGSLEQIDRIWRRTGGPATRLVLPGGHSPHLEQPERVLAAIAEFVADPSGAEHHSL
ncbi:MAG: alpha/beta hydrolase [Solirubrobacteraceae bacterium]